VGPRVERDRWQRTRTYSSRPQVRLDRFGYNGQRRGRSHPCNSCKRIGPTCLVVPRGDFASACAELEASEPVATVPFPGFGPGCEFFLSCFLGQGDCVENLQVQSGLPARKPSSGTLRTRWIGFAGTRDERGLARLARGLLLPPQRRGGSRTLQRTTLMRLYSLVQVSLFEVRLACRPEKIILVT
jgi:hypothetical protein